MNARVKKSIAILVTVVMVLAMAVQSFAAPLSYANPTAVTGTEKVTGIWSKDAAGNWHFNSQGGVAKDGWYYLNTTNKATDYNWFCFDANGVMKTGWVQDKADPSVWYYAGETKDSSEGGLVKGWATDPRDGKRYYMDPSTGIMRYGWQLIGNVWYYFGEKQYSNASHPYGAMYVNEKTPDGYYVGSNGTWQQNTSSGGNSNDKPDPAPKSYYTVTFNMQGHGTQIAPITNVTSGSKIPAPKAPTADGFIFAGWYKESACTNPWNFGTDTVTANTTLYAKWRQMTIKDILATVAGEFPAGDINVPPSNAWVNGENRAYRSSAILVLRNVAAPESTWTYIRLNTTVEAGNGFYKASTEDFEITFNMVEDKLISFVCKTKSTYEGDDKYDGTYAPFVPVTSVSLGIEEITLTVGDEDAKLSATVLPENATDKSVNWLSSDESVATVDNAGNVHAVAAGDATITVTTVDGNKTATCAVKVTAKTWGVIGDFSGWATDVPMTEKESNVFVSPAIELTISDQFKVRYGGGWDKDYGASEDPEPYVITSGVAVEAMEGGYNLAVPTDGEYIVTLDLRTQFQETITVTKVVVPVESVSLNLEELSLTVGDPDKNLTATVLPENATDKSVTWSSSNTDVATVDNEGKVHAVAAGTATITVSTVDGNKTATCAVKVAAPAPEINTIADVLATVEGFPKDKVEDSAPTAPSDAWTNGTGVSAFTYKNIALVLKSDKYMSATLATGVMFDATNNCYTATVSTLGTLKFNLTDGVLTDFTYTHNKDKPETYDGTYAAPAAPTFKAVAEKDTNNKYTLTFYYDAVDHSGDNITVYEDGTDNYLFDDEKEEREKWGYNSIRSNVKSVVIDSSVENYNGLTSTAYMFYNMTSASSITGAEYLDVSNVTDMNHMFVYYGFYCEQLTAVPDVSGWNTENVTNMSEMFNGYGYSSTGLTAVPDVSGWNTGNVTNMSYMFLQYGYSSTALSFTLDLSKWSVAKVTNYSSVFHNAGAKTATWSVTIPAKTGNRANDATHWYVGDGTNYIVPAENKAFTLPSTTLMKLKTSRGTAISDIIGDSIPTLASPDEAIYEAWNSDNSTWCYVFSDEDDADEKFLVFSDLMDSIRISLNKTAAKIQNEVALEGEEVYKYESQDYIIYFNLMEGHLESIEFESKGDEISSYDGIYRAPETIPDEIEIKETKESIETDDVKDIPDGETEKDEADLDPEVPEVIAEVKEQEVSEDNKEIVPEEQSQPVVAEEVIGQSIPDEEVDQKQPEQETN